MKHSSREPGKPWWRRLWIALVPIAVGGIAAFVNGLGSNVAERVTSSKPPVVSYSAKELSGDCVGVTFLPQRAAAAALQARPPADWSSFQRQSGAAFAERDVVEVSVQGESARTITLTGIHFNVTRATRPNGMLFSDLCGGPMTGRAIKVSVDSTPPRILASSADKNNDVLEASTKPIRFPWTVSVTDPLLLYLVATTTNCDCTWSAEIPWVSGAKRGTIKVDNGGNGYRVVATRGLSTVGKVGSRWQR